jgi:putative ABC transport system permease protein
VEVFKQELNQHSGIASVTNSSAVPGLIRWIRSVKIDQEEGMTDRSVMYMEADYDFCKTFGIEVLMGRNFSREMGTDSLEAVLINETAAYEFGWMPNPLGKRIHYGFQQDGSGGRMLKVIGVVRDFNFNSLHNTIAPILIFIQESPGDLLTLRLEEAALGDPLTYVEKKWSSFITKIPFRFEWMTDRLTNVYQNDEKTGTVIRAGTLFIIILALFGLTGLSSFAAEQKIKEVGIRKIHGATLGNILMRLYKEFVILFFIAFVVAIPVSWWRLNLWLESEFVYFREITWFTYLIAGAVSIFVGLTAISYFIVRAARGNPIDAIKYE